jgi:hypothetical protein
MLPLVTQGARHAAARPASPDEIEVIIDKLDKLRSNYGVWRDGLADFLGQQLCDRLHVVTRSQPGGPEVDSADEVRAKVIWHMRRLVGGRNDEKDRQSAAVSFNITPYPQLWKMRAIGDRAQWGYEHGLCLSRGKVDKRTKALMPDLARELGKIQPVPPRQDVEAIIAEFHKDAAGSEPAPESAIQAPQTPKWRRPRVLIAAGIVVPVVAIVSVVAVVNSQSSGDLPVGDDLRAEVLTITDDSRAWSAVFAADQMTAAQPFIQQERRPDDPWEFLRRELDAGAYVAGGMRLGLAFEGNRDEEITVFNIRPLVTPQEIPTGAFVYIRNETGGELDPNLAFNLDEATPVAREILPDNNAIGGVIGQEYFSVQHIGLRKGQKTLVSMRFDVERRAYAFRLEIHYEVAGEKLRMIVDRNGQPFRVTPSPCEYAVLRYDDHVSEEEGWRMVTGEPKDECEN